MDNTDMMRLVGGLVFERVRGLVENVLLDAQEDVFKHSRWSDRRDALEKIVDCQVNGGLRSDEGEKLVDEWGLPVSEPYNKRISFGMISLVVSYLLTHVDQIRNAFRKDTEYDERKLAELKRSAG